MSTLRFYENDAKVADGDGTPSSTQDWSVAIAWGAVEQGRTYKVGQGEESPVDVYECLTGAKSGEVARFRSRADDRMESVRKDAANGMEKEITIEIAEADFSELKGRGYRLCFAKKVADADYNVVWHSYDRFLENNTFSWTPRFQLFCSNTYAVGARGKAVTNTVDITFGETCVLNEIGHIEAPRSEGGTTVITLVNEYGKIHPGLNQRATGIDGVENYMPIYVAPQPMLQGAAILCPTELVIVWFEQGIETSTTFREARSNAVEIDLTGTNSATRRFVGQKWIVP